MEASPPTPRQPEGCPDDSPASIPAADALHRLAFEGAASAMVVASADGGIALSNPAWRALVRREEAELTGLSWWDLLYAEDAERHALSLERLRQGRAPTAIIEARLVARDGSLTWVDLAVTAHGGDDAARPAWFVVHARDATRRKEVERALTSALRERQRVLDGTRDVFLRLDDDGRVIEWNRAAEQAIALPPEEISGRPAFDLMAEEDRPHMMHALFTAFFSGSVEADARLLAGEAKTPQHHRWTLTRVEDDVGNVRGVAAFGRDVAEWRRAQETLRRQSVTKDLVRRLMMALGAHHAQFHLRMRELGREMAPTAQNAPLDEHLAAFSSMGLGTLRLVSVERDRYTFVGDHLLEVTPGASQSTCQLPLGFLEGTVGMLHAGALGTETRCRSLGHATCTFVVQARGNWRGPDASQMARVGGHAEPAA